MTLITFRGTSALALPDLDLFLKQKDLGMKNGIEKLFFTHTHHLNKTP